MLSIRDTWKGFWCHFPPIWPDHSVCSPNKAMCSAQDSDQWPTPLMWTTQWPATAASIKSFDTFTPQKENFWLFRCYPSWRVTPSSLSDNVPFEAPSTSSFTSFILPREVFSSDSGVVSTRQRSIHTSINGNNAIRKPTHVIPTSMYNTSLSHCSFHGIYGWIIESEFNSKLQSTLPTSNLH